MTPDSSSLSVLKPVDTSMKLLHHHNLDLQDECYFLGRYAVGRSYDYYDNQLIFNFKKDMDRRGQQDWPYKARAIQTVARAFWLAISPWGFDSINATTFVPIPPSKIRTDPNYDDRMVRMLRAVRHHPSLDVRELVAQTESTVAAHASLDRLAADELVELYEIIETAVSPTPERIVIVDDVLTTGAHFRATKEVLETRFPDADFVGIFIARSIHLEAEDTDFPEFQN